MRCLAGAASLDLLGDVEELIGFSNKHRMGSSESSRAAQLALSAKLEMMSTQAPT